MCGVHFSFKSLSAGLMSPLGSGSTAQESLEGQNCSFLPVFSNHLLRCFWQWSDRSDLLPDLSNSQCGLPWWAIKTSFIAYWSLSFQFSSVIQFCLTLCNRKDCSTPGFPVYHQLPEFTQTHVYWVSDSIQPSHSVIPFSSTNHAWVHNWLVMTSWVSVVVRDIYLLLPN